MDSHQCLKVKSAGAGDLCQIKADRSHLSRLSTLNHALHLLQECLLVGRGQSHSREYVKNLTARTITCNSEEHLLAVVLFSSNPGNSINLILDLKLKVILHVHHVDTPQCIFWYINL